MAGASVAPLATLLVAVYSTLFSGPMDAALLVALSVIRQRHSLAGILGPSLLREAAKAAIFISALVFVVVQILRIKQSHVETPRWNGPGRVLLFPCRTSHSRMFPQRHSFSYPYLVVGIPVGFEGNAGGMVSVGVQGKSSPLSWLSLGPRVPKAWFTVDAGDYLERGKPELGLRGKLDEYLLTQGADPATYPHAYLITAARFMGYHFNPVSFWYLYDADKRLAAMILEVNNTFDERRIYFLTLDDELGKRIDCPPGPRANEAEQAEHKQQGASRQATFKQRWPKDFHVSPFNSRKGSYTLAASDPLNPFLHGTRPISNTISLVSSKGHCKLVARLVQKGTAVDPHAMTAYQKCIFLVSWWWVGFVTFPRILREAFRLFFHHKLHVWYRPEPLKESIGRRANSTERQLEHIFRRYLQHLVEQSAAPLAVRYNASGISQDATQLMLSPAARDRKEAVEELEFKVLSPVFYARFVYYAHDLEAFFCELNESCTIWVSRPDLLPKLALRKPPGTLESSAFQEYAYFKVIQNLRVRPERIVPSTSSARPPEKAQEVDIRDFRISAMDAYVLAHESPRTRKTYRSCVFRLFLADRIAFGFAPLLEAQRLLVQACVAWFLASTLGELIGAVGG